LQNIHNCFQLKAKKPLTVLTSFLEVSLSAITIAKIEHGKIIFFPCGASRTLLMEKNDGD
jgi:hypothetical protein